MVLTEIALLKWQTNVSLVSEDCWFAVQLSRRIWGKSRSYFKFQREFSKFCSTYNITAVFEIA